MKEKLNTLDDSLKPLQQLVWTLSDLKSCSLNFTIWLRKSVSVEKTNLKTALDAKLKVIDESFKSSCKIPDMKMRRKIQDRVDAQNAAIDLEK